MKAGKLYTLMMGVLGWALYFTMGLDWLSSHHPIPSQQISDTLAASDVTEGVSPYFLLSAGHLLEYSPSESFESIGKYPYWPSIERLNAISVKKSISASKLICSALRGPTIIYPFHAFW